MHKSLILAAMATLVGIWVTAPESQSPVSIPLRVALTVSCLLAVMLTPIDAQRWHTLSLWASIGATMGFGLGGLFGIGSIGIIPFVLVIIYTTLTRDRLNYELNLTGAAVSAMLFVVVAIPIQPFT